MDITMDNLSPQTSLALMQVTQIKGPSIAANADMKRTKESAREFEAVFISEMMKPMFEGIEVDEMFGGGKGEEIFRSMMLQEYGKEIASLDVIGIQNQVLNKLIELQAARTTGDESENSNE